MSAVRWRVSVDRDSCVGTGLCVDAAPGCFTFDGGRSSVVTELVVPDDALVGAAEECPVEAVLIRDGETGARIAPPA
jgi:ferredoxin